jgi:hypothetical protein
VRSNDASSPDRLAGVAMMAVGVAIVAVMAALYVRGRRSGTGAAP